MVNIVATAAADICYLPEYYTFHMRESNKWFQIDPKLGSKCQISLIEQKGGGSNGSGLNVKQSTNAVSRIQIPSYFLTVRRTFVRLKL